MNYRFSQEAPFPAAIEDVKCVARWIRANSDRFGVDGKRVGAMVGSAGGHLVVLLSVTGRSADFDTGPHLKFLSAVQAAVALSPQPAPRRGGLVNSFLGGPRSEELELSRRASLLSYASKNAVPMLLIHGTKDDITPFSQSRVLHEAQ